MQTAPHWQLKQKDRYIFATVRCYTLLIAAKVVFYRASSSASWPFITWTIAANAWNFAYTSRHAIAFTLVQDVFTLIISS